MFELHECGSSGETLFSPKIEPENLDDHSDIDFEYQRFLTSKVSWAWIAADEIIDKHAVVNILIFKNKLISQITSDKTTHKDGCLSVAQHVVPYMHITTVRLNIQLTIRNNNDVILNFYFGIVQFTFDITLEFW